MQSVEAIVEKHAVVLIEVGKLKDYQLTIYVDPEVTPVVQNHSIKCHFMFAKIWRKDQRGANLGII